MLRRPPTLLTLTAHDLASYDARRAQRQAQARGAPSSYAASREPSFSFFDDPPANRSQAEGRQRKRREVSRPNDGEYEGRGYARGGGFAENMGDGEEDAQSLAPTEVDEDMHMAGGVGEDMDIDLDADVPSADGGSPFGSDGVLDPGVPDSEELARQLDPDADVGDDEGLADGQTLQEGDEEEEMQDDTPILTRNPRRPTHTHPPAPSRAGQTKRQPPPPPPAKPRLGHAQLAPGGRRPPPRMGNLSRGGSGMAGATAVGGAPAEGSEINGRRTVSRTAATTATTSTTRSEMRTPSPRLPQDTTAPNEPEALQAPRRGGEAAQRQHQHQRQTSTQGHQQRHPSAQGQSQTQTQQEPGGLARQREDRRARIMGAAGEGRAQQAGARRGGGGGEGGGRRMR